MGASSAEKDFLAKLGGADEESPRAKIDTKNTKSEAKAVKMGKKIGVSGAVKEKDAVNRKTVGSDEKKGFWDKLPLTKWWFWVIVVVLIGTVFSFFTSIGNKISKVEQVYSELEQLDLNGLKINEACEKVRAIGWKIDEVAGENDYSEKSDCSDTEHTVTKYYYHDEKYYEYDGSLRSDYETVGLRFNNAKKEEDKNIQADDASSSDTESQSASGVESAPVDNGSSASSSTTSTPSSSGSSGSSGPSSASSPSTSSTYQSIYDTYSARLRSECPTKSMTECAEIANEGVGKMAEYMWDASGTDGQYETYSDWSSKLYDVYMEAVR